MTRSEAIRKAIDIIVYLEAHFAKSQNAKKDAEEIIKALEQIKEEQPVNKLTQQAYEDGKKDGYFQAKADQILKTGWIPVSERLPEKYTHTLWCASSGYVRSDYFNGEFWEDAEKYCYEVIAWMPLPEPYKAEKEGQGMTHKENIRAILECHFTGFKEEIIESACNRIVEQESKTGHWIFDEILDRHYYCSECRSMGVDYWDYCPYCGAKMVDPQESERINCKTTKCENCQNHNYCDYEPQESEKNE